LKDEVALKIMKPELARHERYRVRFFREAKLCEKLEHENIVAAYDARRTDSYFFYAMEHVDGATVEERIDKDGPFEERLALYVTREVAKALIYLHGRGVIHRDLKPGNFLLTESGKVKIIDLGLAKLPAGMMQDSDAGLTVGTAEYLSPEQARGWDDVDGRSDIYALGVSLFHMVVGEVPFKGDTGQEVIAQQVLSALDRPELKSRQVSAYLHYFIQRMMAKDRADRFQTPEEIIAEIEEKAGDVSDAVRKAPVVKARPALERRPVSRRGKSAARRKKPRGRRGRGR
jgi:serine/threonine protein kinase